MRRPRLQLHLDRARALAILACCLGALGCPDGGARPDSPDDGDASAAWPQFGGADGDFKTRPGPLADRWPAEGPPRLWKRELGEGYSGVVFANGTLFTMYRDGERDVVVALSAEDGRERWRHTYDAPADAGNEVQFGTGPHATPLIVDDRLVTLGYTGELRAFELATGQVAWQHHLIDDLGGEVLSFGYSASPIEVDGKVVVLVGGERGAVAVDPASGDLVWSSEPTSVSYATPLAIRVGGATQLLYFSSEELVAINPDTGGTLWRHPVVNRYRNNASMPVWGDDGLLWVATQEDGGARVLRVQAGEEGVEVEKVWENPRIRVHFWNALRLDGTVYASIGGQASILAAIDVASGEILWRERGFSQVNFVHAGDRTVMLDQNGELALVRLDREGLEILGQVTLLDDVAWTAPTLVGSTLYVRDKHTVQALDLHPRILEAAD